MDIAPNLDSDFDGEEYNDEFDPEEVVMLKRKTIDSWVEMIQSGEPDDLDNLLEDLLDVQESGDDE